jgi:zinc protease
MRPGRAGAAATAVCLLALVGAAALGAQNLSWPVEGPPGILPAREVPFPPYEIRTLGNGMQVMTVLHHEQPAVTMHLLIRAGAAHDPDTKDGVAFLAAQLLDQGTTTRTASQIADQIDSIGGSMGTSAQQDRTVASAVVMKDSFDLALNLLADIVRNPAFDPQEIARQKEQILSLLRVNAEDPDYIANIVFDRLVYGLHPYGLPGSGTPETIAAITRQDLIDFHRRYFTPNNMILAIVGDVTNTEAFAAAQRVFGSWPRAAVPAVKAADPPAPTHRIVVVDKPDAVQTEIRVGQIAIPRKHPDYLAWDLAVRILGGEGANRLHRVLRSERGLTYGASAETEARKQAGDFVAETDTRTETTGEALRIIREEMVRLQTIPVSPRELGDAQAYLAGSFPLTIETPNDIAVQVLNAVFFELPLDEIGTFHTRVVSVTPADVQRVARQYIRPDSLSIVLVGNAKAFVPQLRQLGMADFEVIPISELDLTSPTLSRSRIRVAVDRPLDIQALSPRPTTLLLASQTRAQTPAPRPAPGAQTPPRPAPAPSPTGAGDGSAADLLRRVIDARGGLAALKAVRSVVAESDTTFMGEQGEVADRTTTKTYVIYPDKFRIDATLSTGTVSQVFNAGRAWEKGPAGVRDLPAQMRNDAAASVRRDTIPLLVAAGEGRLSVRAFVEGGQRVLEVSGQGLDPVRLFLDDKMMVVKQQFSASGPNGRSMQQEESFGDYRTIGGMRVPFEASVLHEGRPIVKRTLTKITFNETVDPALFERPQDTPRRPETSRPPTGR